MDAEKKVNGPEDINDESLKKVSGGFQQTIPGFSYGEIIQCPSCGNANSGEFYCDGDELAAVQKDLYTCAICGQQFAVASGFGITDVF